MQRTRTSAAPMLYIQNASAITIMPVNIVAAMVGALLKLTEAPWCRDEPVAIVGGGNAAGPSRGIDDGAGTVGFDCSGLILYAFAGVGIKLPHYSGSQYDAGRKIPSSEMRRGDVIFYGPGGSQHVTLYLGNGQMLEAPYTGSDVHISPVRTSGMTPYVIRYIEY